MRGDPSQIEIASPTSLAAALTMLADRAASWVPLAGGTDLMVVYEAGQMPQKRLLSLHQLDELRGIRVSPAAIEIGALCTYGELRHQQVISAEFPNMVRAAAETGGLAIQNRGTIGGNIINASPAADTPPALLCYDAELEIVSQAGSRWVPYHGFHTAYKKHALKPDEILKTIRLPRAKIPTNGKTLHFYRKVGTRKAQAISKVVLAGVGTLTDKNVSHFRVAVGSVASIPWRCVAVEKEVLGKPLTAAVIDQACQTIAAEVTPIDDIRSTREYRQLVAVQVLRQFLEDLRDLP